MQIQLKLDTDYATTGNSSGMQIDTLSVAMDGRGYNELEEYNMDYLWEIENHGKVYWLDTEAEAFFQNSLSKQQLIDFADDLPGYNKTLKEYRELFDDVRAGDWDTESPHAEAMKACAEAMEEALSRAQKDLHRDWLYGDYSGNFEGVLPKANKYIDGVEFDYNEKDDIITIDVSEETLKQMVEDGEIEKASDIKDYVESAIESKARGNYAIEKMKAQKRAEEAKKRREYKMRMATEAIESKKAKLLEIAKNK